MTKVLKMVPYYDIGIKVEMKKTKIRIRQTSGKLVTTIFTIHTGEYKLVIRLL